MRVQVPPRAQTKQRISPGQSTFYGMAPWGLSPDLSHTVRRPSPTVGGSGVVLQASGGSVPGGQP